MGKVHFESDMELQKWLQLGRVDFVEIFSGLAQASIRVREAGWTTAEGFDKAVITYERCWHLDREDHQSDLCWVLENVLQP